MAVNFYPRSPCGERLHYDNYNLHCVEISIHALLAESDSQQPDGTTNTTYFYPRSPCGERHTRGSEKMKLNNFYPRSPCGERPITITITCIVSRFLSTLSLRRATRRGASESIGTLHFYPRSPCGERRHWQVGQKRFLQFLSTLSLRRATFRLFFIVFDLFRFLSTLSLRRATRSNQTIISKTNNFYPRSPCGERHLLGFERVKL